MICQNCGDNIEGDSGFCPTCGAKIGIASVNNIQAGNMQMPNQNMNDAWQFQTPEKSKKSLIIAIVIILVILVAIGVLIGVKASDSKSSDSNSTSATTSSKDGMYVINRVNGLDAAPIMESMGFEDTDFYIEVDGDDLVLVDRTSDVYASGTIEFNGNSGIMYFSDGTNMSFDYNSKKGTITFENLNGEFEFKK